MNLEFESSDGSRRTIAEAVDGTEARKAMMKFLDNHNYKTYYQRYTLVNGEIQVDVGSWSEFFWITDLSEKDVKEFIKV